LAPGQILEAQDKYEVGPVIGEGGYGVVYSAASSVRGMVALKEFIPGATVAEREQVRDLFVRERDVLWQLRFHPHLPDLIEAFTQDGMRYLVLEFVPGESLRERLDREGALPPEEAGLLSLQLTRAVAALHARGLVHHDIKPANVKLGPTGLAVLLDLGSARAETAYGQPSGLARSPTALLSYRGVSQIAGTAGYMAPELKEMVETDSLRSHCTLDVFALGCTIYELVTNQRLEQDRIDGRDEQLVAEAVQQVRVRCPHLVAPVAQALALSSGDRYATAREMLGELEQVVPPRPAFHRQRLDFRLSASHVEDEQIVLLTNAGGGRLAGRLRSECSALTLRRPDGATTDELTFSGNATLVRVVANGGRRGGGEEVGELIAKTEHGVAKITCHVQREMGPPQLSVTPSRATLRVTRETLQQLTVRVTNAGAGTRVTAHVIPRGSVEVTPSECDCPPVAEIAFRIRPNLSAGALSPGRRQVTVTFVPEGAEASPPLHLTIEVAGFPWGFRPRR
jgi:hypothetical protein